MQVYTQETTQSDSVVFTDVWVVFNGEINEKEKRRGVKGDGKLSKVDNQLKREHIVVQSQDLN